MDNENKIDALNVSEEAKRTADIDRAAAFQYHSPLSPAPPSYPPVQGGGSTLKRQRSIRLFIVVILALAVLAFISGIIWLIASFKLSFRSEDGGFSIKVQRKGHESGFTDLPADTAVPTQKPDTQNPQPDEHRWNGSSINLEKPDENSKQMDFKEIYKSMSGSVVSVTSVYGSDELKATGTVISEDGLILTVCSAVLSSDAISVGHNGQNYAASIVGLDYAADVAVIKIKASGLKAAVFGSSEKAAAGDSVAVVGNPVEGKMNLFSGMLSAVNEDFAYRGYHVGILQVNMSLGSGASGSPLINEYGQVIGIIDMAIAAEYPEAGSICFALPISNIKSVIDDLLHYGYVPGRPVSGLAVSDLPPALAAFYRLPNGVVITDVKQGSTAYAAGVRRNDVVFEANGVKIENSSDLMAVINGMKAGDELTLGLYREGEKGYITFKLMEANAEVR